MTEKSVSSVRVTGSSRAIGGGTYSPTRNIKKDVQAMTQQEYEKIKSQLEVLREVAEVYSGRTIDNIIQQLEACTKHAENNITTLY